MGFSVILTEKGGPTQRLDFYAEEITVGRVDENDICLPKGNISKKHTKIVVKDGKIIVLDLKSTNGTYVNGKKLAGPQVIQPSDTVYIGDFILNVEPPDLGEPADFADRGAERPAPPAEEDSTPTSAPGKLRMSRVADTTPSPRSASAVPSSKPPARAPAGRPARGGGHPAAVPDHGRTLSLVHDRLIEAMDLRRLDLDALGKQELRDKTEGAIRQIVGKMDAAGELDAHLDRDELVSDVLNEALGLGPLEIYLADDSVTEIMVNAPSEVYVERSGRLERAP